MDAIRDLLRVKTRNKVRNKGNVKRFARRCGINNPMQHSVGEMITMSRECKLRTRKLMTKSPWMHKELLFILLSEAMRKYEMEEATRVKEILRNEAQKKV